MQQQIYADVSHNERLDMLKANCRETEVRKITVQFTPDDLMDIKDRLSDHSVELEIKQEQLKDISSQLKGEIKKVNEQRRHLVKLVKNKCEERDEQVFDFDDQENGLMLTYNSVGDLISSRKLRPAEKQTSIITMSKTA